MTLKNIFTLAVLSLLINSSGAFAADNSAVVGKWDMELSFQGQGVTINLTITFFWLTWQNQGGWDVESNNVVSKNFYQLAFF